MRLILFAMIVSCASTAQAADRYLDDRSLPEQLIRSLYSAINLHQYSRAYTYFSDPPAKDFDTYAKGYENTAHVDVLLGDVTSEGAAGSVFSNVPVAIRAKDDKGAYSYFAGCYVVRQVNADQDPPYQPLQIQSAKLKPAKESDFDRYALPKCGDIEPDQTAEKPSLDDVKAKFAAETQGECNKAGDTLAGLNDPQIFPIAYKAEGDDQESKVTLYLFSCTMAAYNETSVAYLADDDTISRLSFAVPHLKITYKDEENTEVKSTTVDGYESKITLTNAEFDSKTATLSEFSKWRGVGDASSNASWIFFEGIFVLKSYDVDATYDGKQEPMPILRGGKLVLKP